MRNRRSFLAWAFGLLGASAVAQKAIMKEGQAVVCESESIKCPNGHATCRIINAPLVVGNDRRDYPDMGQLYEYHVLRCDTCRVLFTRE